MATISLTISDTQINRVVTDFCAVFGYQATINGAPNPQTQGQFTKQQIANWIRNVCANYEASQASSTSAATATNDVLTNVTVT